MNHITLSIILLLLSYSLPGAAQTDHQHASAIGIHGMALFEHNGSFYASHMPLSNSIHAHQVIFSIDVDTDMKVKLQSLLNKFELVSLMPELFDLIKLMDGTIKTFKANIHSNHFERGGKIALKDVTIQVKRLLLVENLKNVNNGNFYWVPTENNSGLLVHQIGNSPGFDQILSAEYYSEDNTVTRQQKTLLKLTSGTPVNLPLKGNKNIKILKQLYLETQDFK